MTYETFGLINKKTKLVLFIFSNQAWRL